MTMRILYSFILGFICCQTCYAQDSAGHLVVISNLPPKGLLLDKGWKFQAGDNPAFAKPDYDDRAWADINPALDVHDSLPQIPLAGICWLRIQLAIDSAILKNQLALVIQQSGASEIFLDGTLLDRSGQLGQTGSDVKATDPSGKPVFFPVTDGGRHVLAVRFALQAGIRYTTIFEAKNPGLRMTIQHLDSAIDDYHVHRATVFIMASSIIGLFVLAFILHLAFYVFYPPQKANLLFSLFALLFAVENLCRIWLVLSGDVVSSKFYISNICFALNLVSDLLLLAAIHVLSDQKRDWFYRGLLILVVISILFIIPRYGWWWIVGGALLDLLIKVDIMRIAFRAVRRQQRGARIIAWGAISCLIFFALFLFDGVFGYDHSDILNLGLFRLALYIVSVLSIPVATSIYLGLDFAFTNQALAKKLVEVEALSQKTISQEKEKQEILSSQNETLEIQVAQRTTDLNQSLENLKSTQAKLIQAEKMASLGEMTAGIAHEIQNPLNFVNNFSELNRELLEELEGGLSAGNREESISIAADIRQNEEKISYHGKRAEAIVKAMLQHSRTSAGEKQLTNLNAMAEEYLQLSYHGLRAKEKGLHATIKTDFDEKVGETSIVAQDIARVLLNMYNNAFYAVSEKAKRFPVGYEPTVSVASLRRHGRIEMAIMDNGDGIPNRIMEKIFQPFFTTKPTGEGTGLGLSLSYDIVRAHGGEIRVETQEGEYTRFIILLPADQ